MPLTMSKKAIFFSSLTFVLSLTALGAGGMAWYQAWMNQPLEAPVLTAPIEITDVAGVTPAEGDLALDLASLDEGGNTQVLWHCGKSIMGMREEYTGAWTHLTGRVLLEQKTRTLRAGELHVAVGAMRGHGAHPAPGALINTVRRNQWFLEEEHPTAVFRGRSLAPRAAGEEAGFEGAVEGWSHRLGGTFQLNGIERELSVPARVVVGEDSVRIDAVFPISRAEFGVARRRGFEPPAEVDDQVVLEVHIHAAPDPMSIVASLNRQLVAQQAATGALEKRAAELGARLQRFETALEEMRRELARKKEVKANGDPSSLPARFKDRVDYSNSAGDAHYKDLGYAPEFEMVRVPGDPEKGIAPFYVQTTEVTWQMFRAWSYCEDIADEQLSVKLREEELRPSPCYDDASRGHGFEKRPALGVSRRNALAFCRYMSERSGRPYRLMTDAEWHYLVEAAGGFPEKPLDIAWLADNADTDDFGDPISMPIASKPADRLGLHDLWGNVAEWVMADEEYIRGGSYLVSAEQLSLDWKEEESQDVWNETYPNSPKSKWWYRDRFDMGFRLVCDPVNIPGGK